MARAVNAARRRRIYSILFLGSVFRVSYKGNESDVPSDVTPLPAALFTPKYCQKTAEEMADDKEMPCGV